MTDNAQQPVTPAATRCGFVALIGAPNVGKSTLVNALVGSKVTIVSRKVQTTRALIRGIVVENNAQIILVDTPGIFAPKRRLDRAMVSTAWSGAHDADLVCVLIDAREGLDEEADAIFTKLASGRRAKNGCRGQRLPMNVCVSNRPSWFRRCQAMASTICAARWPRWCHRDRFI